MSLSIDAPKFASFDALRETALGCTECALSETRTQVVFGVGDAHADLLFVGEGPGEQEDLQGEPFVGRAGQLLTMLIEGIGLTRADVYIANVVKCRPPGNRDPLPVEIETCRPYLEAQLDFIDPTVVVTLGNFATKLLLQTKDGITKLRGRELPFRERAVIVPVLHPAAVLRNTGATLAQTRADFVTVKRALAGSCCWLMEICSRSAEETLALGERLARLLRCGDVVVLSGDLGAGKTVLAKGIAAGLGVTEPVVSPTFTIVREYEGAVPLQHLDVYRLDHLQEVIDLGLDELLDGHAVTVVEWGEAVSALLPHDRLEVVLMVPPPEEADDDTRVIELHGTGPSWAARGRALSAAVTGNEA